MQTHSLKVTKRDVFGKKVKKLRREGVLPANVFGKEFESTAIQVPVSEFTEVYEAAGHSGLVELKLDGKTVHTLIHEVVHDPVTQAPLHADFHKVSLKEKVKAVVPVVLTGDATAVTEKLGMLMQDLSEVEVEALPTELPEKIEVDVTSLAEVGASLTIADLPKTAGVEILTAPEHTVARIAELVSKEAEEQAAAEAAAAEEASAEGGEAPAEGQAPATEETPAAE